MTPVLLAPPGLQPQPSKLISNPSPPAGFVPISALPLPSPPPLDDPSLRTRNEEPRTKNEERRTSPVPISAFSFPNFRFSPPSTPSTLPAPLAPRPEPEPAKVSQPKVAPGAHAATDQRTPQPRAAAWWNSAIHLPDHVPPVSQRTTANHSRDPTTNTRWDAVAFAKIQDPRTRNKEQGTKNIDSSLCFL